MKKLFGWLNISLPRFCDNIHNKPFGLWQQFQSLLFLLEKQRQKSYKLRKGFNQGNGGSNLFIQFANVIDHLIKLCFHAGQSKAKTINISTEFSALKRMMPLGIIMPIQQSLTVNLPTSDGNLIDSSDIFSVTDLPTISGIGDEAEILSSLQRPKKVLMALNVHSSANPRMTFGKMLHDGFSINGFDHFSEPAAWFRARIAYAHTTAVWSMVGHIVGLGDRHGENILFDSTTGDCVHVDFSCLFDKGLLLEKPELVPFRLTQNMIDGLGITGYEGIFLRVCEITLSVLRIHRGTLMSVLETFIHDPLVEWTKSHKSSRVEVQNPHAQRAISNIEARLQGVVVGVGAAPSLPLAVEAVGGSDSAITAGAASQKFWTNKIMLEAMELKIKCIEEVFPGLNFGSALSFCSAEYKSCVCHVKGYDLHQQLVSVFWNTLGKHIHLDSLHANFEALWITTIFGLCSKPGLELMKVLLLV
ncbi:hypothetical protein FNV43_RR21857 [Rhamnella rubrinervis]|uniref:Serine/threonine-protein kinase ATR n=1 Tax=Rhamnella rubrinervis TaxID=2594499 RepID=A0A8K0GRI8_9ROSA|nr:hypothetical protein FNV43_RR21857 [Rhamnella rubrinervis]